DSGVEESGEGCSCDHRLNDGIEELPVLLRSKNAAVAIRTHASGIWAGVVIEYRLVVLGSGQRDGRSPIAECDETDFLADQEFFDHQSRSQAAHGGFSLGAIRRDDDSLSRSQAVRLDYNRKVELG